MNDRDSTRPEHLLDYHLGLLEGTQAEPLEREIAGSAESAAQSRNVSRWLELLDHHKTPPPPTRLVDRIMDGVEHALPLRVTEAASSLPPSSEGESFRRPRLSLGEIIALAACIVFFVGIVVPGVSQHRSRGRRAVCANNLGNIYRGLSQYAASFNGYMPQTAGFSPGVNWLRSPRPGVSRIPNRRNCYLLVRFRFTTPKSFICPAVARARAMGPDQIDRFDDFPAVENCSFDSQNMAGPTLPLGAEQCVPIYADRNPLFDGAGRGTANTPTSNSLSHDGGSGQNVLCGDGRVLWTTTPLFGSRGDNIWQVEGVTTYTGTEYQQHPTDAFVIP